MKFGIFGVGKKYQIIIPLKIYDNSGIVTNKNQTQTKKSFRFWCILSSLFV